MVWEKRDISQKWIIQTSISKMLNLISHQEMQIKTTISYPTFPLDRLKLKYLTVLVSVSM